jgi:hypothetical protein
MINNVFTVANVFCPYKDYSSFLGGKLIVLKLCNYDKNNGVIFGIILLFMKLILLLVNFSRTIRIVGVYFIVYTLFSCLCLV